LCQFEKGLGANFTVHLTTLIMTTTQVQEYPNILKGIEGMLKNQTLEMSRISRLIETENKNMQKKLELKIKPLQKELETLKKDYESLQQEANKLKGE
jgi:uncharacterized protein HemX